MQRMLSSSLNQFTRPAMVMPLRDLSAAARQGKLQNRQLSGELIEALSRGLFRSSRTVLLIGDSGVGKSTLLEELAFQSHSGLHQHLTGKRFLAIDCQRIAHSDMSPFFSAMSQSVSQEPGGIWCLDNAGHALMEFPLRSN